YRCDDMIHSFHLTLLSCSIEHITQLAPLFHYTTLFRSSGDIKREAKAQLQGNWRSAVILALIPSLFSVFFIGTTARDPMNQTLLEDLVDMLLNIIHTFLLIGVSFTFLDFIRQRIEFIDPLQGLIEAFRLKYFTNLLLLKITKYLYIFLWSLLLVVPGVMKAYSYSQAEYIYKDIVDRT